MFIIGFPVIWAICISTAMFCYFSVPCLTARNLRITFALSLFVAAMSSVVITKPGEAGIYAMRFVAEMYWFASTVAASCLLAFGYRWRNAK